MSDAVVPAAVSTAALNWPGLARSIQVTDDAQALAVSGHLADIKALRGEIAKTFDPIDRAQIEARRVTIQQRKLIEDPLAEAEKILKNSVGAYAAEQQRKAREAAAMAESIAREAREKAEKAARELEAMGEPEFADAVREEAQVASAPPVVAPPVKVAGLTIGETWTFEIVDLKALVEAVAAGKAPPAFLKPDETAIGGWARSMKGTMQIPGVRVFTKPRVGTRG